MKINPYATIIIAAFVFSAVMIYMVTAAQNNQINDAKELANKTITENMSLQDKTMLSKTACDIYYRMDDRDTCFEAVMKEHV